MVQHKQTRGVYFQPCWCVSHNMTGTTMTYDHNNNSFGFQKVFETKSFGGILLRWKLKGNLVISTSQLRFRFV